MAETPTTELQAVNILIGTIGTAPIQSLTGPLSADVSAARSILSEVVRAVQTVSWHFNSEYDYPMIADSVTGKIAIPQNFTRIDVQDDWQWDVTQRGGFLYSKKKRTFDFGAGTTLLCEVLLQLPFDDLPEVARRYCNIRAARIFQARYVGAEELDGFTAAEEMQALMALQDAEGDTADHSLFNNYAAADVLDRQNGVRD